MKRINIILTVLLAFVFADCHAQGNEVKTFTILGDSYSTFEGYIPEGNACWYFTTPHGENDVTNVEQTWWHIFAKQNGYELLLNDSYSGSTICNTGYDGADYSDRAFITRMFNVTAGNPDLIIVFGGTNDSWANAPIGELKYNDWTSSDMYSCLPSCCFMLEHLTAVAKDAQIVFLINSELKEEITEGIIEACKHYGVQSLLLKDIDKIWSHPSVKGMSQISEQLSAFIK
ncbi:MAG: hypothetical protein IKW20_08780 [Bacteroidales bacterium]|nr:hypothetical protein [Bacteroidales bacterium]MBR5834488.1 hypothetical protein [Bacteroidales bacterium]